MYINFPEIKYFHNNIYFCRLLQTIMAVVTWADFIAFPCIKNKMQTFVDDEKMKSENCLYIQRKMKSGHWYSFVIAFVLWNKYKGRTKTYLTHTHTKRRPFSYDYIFIFTALFMFFIADLHKYVWFDYVCNTRYPLDVMRTTWFLRNSVFDERETNNKITLYAHFKVNVKVVQTETNRLNRKNFSGLWDGWKKTVIIFVCKRAT